MKKVFFILLCFFLSSFNTYASDRGPCVSYESEYGKDILYDLNEVPILEAVKTDLEKANLLGNLPSSLNQGTSIQKIFYQDGSLLMETPFLNNKKNGSQKIYYDNQNLLAQVPYVNGLIHGDMTVYYSNGNIKMSIAYQNGKRTGTGKMFYENGNIQLSETYQNGLREGVQTQYYSDGMTIQSVIPYKDGKINGTVKLYYPDTTTLAIVEFDQGNVVSNMCYTKMSQTSSLNQIALYKLRNGMRPIYCTYWNEDGLY